MNFESKFLHTAEKIPQHHSTDFRNLGIVIEWPKGSVRTGEDKNGKKWKRKMEADYGYVPDTTAAGDKEDLDVYVGPNGESDKVYIVEQLDDEGEFDEYKCLLGFDDLDTAYETYLKHYPEGWDENNVAEVYEVPFRYLFDAVEEHQEKQEKTAAPALDPAIERMFNPTHGMKQKPAVEGYVWISPGRNEDYILPGNYSDHHKFQEPRYMNGRPIKKNDYDNSPRGYAEVNNSTKTVNLSLSPNISHNLSFIPESLMREFKDKFPGYKIYKNAGKSTGLAYLKALTAMKNS